MVEATVFFLGLALILYTVLGGADFGAGIWEIFKGRARAYEQEALVAKALGPVWEANHIWLILALVIVFTAFPQAFWTISVSFHVPLTLLLIGITLRGCAFTFRTYDARQDQVRQVYTRLFAASSLLTPLTLGLIAGGLLLGRITTEPTSYYEGFIAPWFNWFCLAVGIFLITLVAYVAAVFLYGETSDPQFRDLFRRRAQMANGAAIGAGLLVFFAAETSGLNLIAVFLTHPLAIAAMVLATVAIVAVHRSLSRDRYQWARLFAAAQIGLVLIGWFALQYPALLIADGTPLTFREAAAPPATLVQLLIALGVGCVLILPATAYLFFLFKIKTPTDEKAP